jgi:DNA-binding NarL/FixJ family response regulator
MDRVKSCAAPNTVRIFLLVGNRLLYDTLLRLFHKPADVSIVGQGLPSVTPAEDVQKSLCHVVLTDFMPSTRPEAALSWASRAHTLLIGMDDDEDQFLAAVRAGYRGYLLKDACAADVLNAVRALSRGEAVCPPRLCMALFKWIADGGHETLRADSDARPSLTIRQQQLVSLVARGLTNKEIASELNLSEFTVKNHLRRIMRQVDAESRQEAVQTARAHGYLLADITGVLRQSS